MDGFEEIIKRVWTNLKNWSSWDFSDFRLTETEGKAVQEVLRLYLEGKDEIPK